MAKEVIDLEIKVILEDTNRRITKFADDTQRRLDAINFNTAVSAIKDGFEIIGQISKTVLETLSRGFGKAIEEASSAEDATKKLANAMALVGDFSKTAITDFQDFADSMRVTRGVADEVVLKLAALAKNYNLTNKEARRAVEAGIDFATITGRDLNSSVETVSRTLTGFVDRDLARIVPGLKGLSREALIAGEGLSLIQQRVAGAGTQNLEGFSGLLLRITLNLNELFQTIGQIIIKNPILLGALRAIGDAFGDLNDSVTQNNSAINNFVNSTVVGLGKNLGDLVSFVQAIDQVFSSLFLVFTNLGKAIGGVAAAVVSFSEGTVSGFAKAKEALSALSDDIADSFQANQKRIIGFYDPIIKAAEKAGNKIEKLSRQATTNVAPAGKGGSGRSPEEIVNARLANLTIEQIRAINNELSNNPFLIFFKENRQGSFAAVGAGIVQNILKGAEGARNVISSTVGAIADSIVPGIGGAVKEIINILSQGPAKVKQLLREFFDAIPQIITNIVEGIVGFLEELPNVLPKFIEKLIAAIFQIIQAFISGIPAIVAGIIENAPKIAAALITGIIQGIPKIIEGFARELIKLPGRIIDAIAEGIGNIFGGLSGNGRNAGFAKGIPIVGDIVSGIGNVIESIGDFFGFADGGRVPDVPSFNGDRFPARLSAGEQVLTKDLSNRLDDFLSGSGGSQTIVLQVGQRELARVLLDINQREFRTA